MSTGQVIVGNCYYCGQPVFEDDNKGAYTKKWDKKSQRYVLSDWWHMDCYYYRMKELQGRPQEYRQISLFDLMEAKQ